MSSSRASAGAGALVWTFVLTGLVSVALAFVILFLMQRKPAAPVAGSAARADALLGQAEPRQPAVAEVSAGSSARPRPAASLPARTEPAAAPPTATAPEPTPDPFARHGAEDPPARALVAVGDVQLGVLASARVRDEAQLVELLTRLGGDLERLRPAPGQAAGAARQELLESYKRELGRYVDGEVELRGRDWLMGLEVGEVRPLPLPTEPDWRPRPE